MIESERRVSDGREVDFQKFYGDAYDRVARLGFLLTGSETVGEELAQDAFLKLYRNWDEVREPAAWVRTVLVNGSRTYWRTARREPPPATTSAQADHSDLLAVRAALAALPIKERTAVVLRFYADLPERAIAETMGVPAGSVKSLLHRGLRRLKGVLS